MYIFKTRNTAAMAAAAALTVGTIALQAQIPAENSEASQNLQPQERNAQAQPQTPQEQNVQAKLQTPKLNDDLQGPFFIVDETPANTVKILEALTGQVAIMAPNLPNVKINFSTSGKLTRSEAIIAFKSLLAANGIAIIPLGEKFFKATPVAGSNSQAPELITGSAKDISPSQALYTKLYELKYIDIEGFNASVLKFLSADAIASLAIFPQKNAFILSDTLLNHQRIETLLSKLDTPTRINEDIGVIMLKNMSAEDLKRRFATLKSEILRKYFDRTTIEADERTNQVIIATARGNLKNITDIIEKLDVDAQPLTKSEVFYIRHGEAKDIESVLNSIVKGQKAAAKNAQSAKVAAANTANRMNRIANAQNRGTGAARLPTNITADPTGAALQFSDYITIVADERSNSVVVYGTPTDLKQIGDIIDKIDVVLAQVKIDVIITEVTLTDNQTSGLSSFGLGYSTLPDADGKKGWTGNTTMAALDGTETSPFTLSIDEYGFNSVFSVASQNNNIKILSAPSIVTTHNKEATINVSETQALITQTTSIETTDYPQTKNTVEWKDIGIILEVKPLIGENGVVQMEIKQTVESVVRTQIINDISQPVIGKREAESFVSAKSGETVVLAGLQQTKANKTDGEVFLLSDIPLIGNIFKPESEKTERTELIIFIRPTMLHSQHYSKIIKENEITSKEVSKEVEQYFKTGKFHDPEKETMGLENRKYSSFEKTIIPKSLRDSKDGENSKDEENVHNSESAQNSDSGEFKNAETAENPQKNKDAKKLRGLRK